MRTLRPSAAALLAPSLLALLACGTASAAGKGTIKIALLFGEVVNVSQADRSRLESTARERLSRIAAFSLLDHRKVSKVAGAGECGAPCLRRLATSLGADRVLRLEIGRLGQTYMLRLTLHDARQGTRRGSWQKVLSSIARGVAAPALDEMIAGFAPRPPPKPTPWYRRWWVWTIAGAVVAGGVTTAVIFATRPRDPGPDHIIDPP